MVMLKKNKRNYTLKVFENGKKVDRCQTHSLRRFRKHLRTINWQKSQLEMCLRVNYGKGFVNEGNYWTKKDLWLAFNAFIER